MTQDAVSHEELDDRLEGLIQATRANSAAHGKDSPPGIEVLATRGGQRPGK